MTLTSDSHHFSIFIVMTFLLLLFVQLVQCYMEHVVLVCPAHDALKAID